MKREDAFYHKIMLMTGLDDGYDEWLSHFLNAENPLSDIVLELACCGSDTNRTISVLDHYCAEQPFDESVVCTRIRLFLQNAYHAKRMSIEEITSSMYCLANNVGDPGDFDMQLWGSMYYLDYYHDLAKDGIIAWDRFYSAFFAYLDNGIPVDSDSIWGRHETDNQHA